MWSIVLAGGDGVRTNEFIQHWLGHEKPKQYCTFFGSRSMFQHTLDRAARLTPWEREVVVAARHQQYEIRPQLNGRPAGMVLLQHKKVDTAAGILSRDEGTFRGASATGSLWNTMVLAAKGKELWRLGRTCFPEMVSPVRTVEKGDRNLRSTESP